MTPGDPVALHSAAASIILEIAETGAPLWRHLGARVDPAGLPPIASLRGRATFSPDWDRAADLLPLAASDSRAPAIRLRTAHGAALPVAIDECRIDHDADRLVCELVDRHSGIAVTVEMSRAAKGFAIATTLHNRGSEPVQVDRLASACFPLPATAQTIVSWRGRHNAEFVECREPMPAHGWVREVRRGLTGHGGPCGAYVLDGEAGWHSGLVVALQLAWSGDSRLAIERTDEGGWTCMAEAVFQPGELALAPGESYAAPPVLLAIGTRGRNSAIQQMHAMTRARIGWPGGTMAPRPVHLNSWEACYFAHDEQRIGALAESAAAIGIERFILDDGWFRGRKDDTAGLGDWTPDPVKYPSGLKPIADRVRALGMEFGLWVEPEMVNPDSDLYRGHPDWVLAVPGRGRPTARNQLVLDMRRDEVRDHLFERLDTLLRDVPIGYLKWDHNRDHTPPGGAAWIRGTYDLLARLRAAHPQVEIESCAGGGGRIDAGILAYAHRFWTSDNIDAVARVPMQRGFLAFMPPETMGAHVGASPSHATGRRQPLDFRALVACQGHFGVELDPAAMDEAERARLADWIGFYKDRRHVIHGGTTHLGEGTDGLLWQAQGTEDELLLWLIRRDHGSDRHAQPVRLPFAGERDWEVQLVRQAVSGGVLTPRSAPAFEAMRGQPQRFAGSWLAGAGLPLPALPAESGLVFHLKAIR